MNTEPLALSKIDTTAGTQCRAALDADAVADYAEAYKRGDTLPPLTVYSIPPGRFVLVDGFHRHAAAVSAGLEAVPCAIEPRKTLAEARFAAACANRTHGVRRSREDKRNAVRVALAVRPNDTDRMIGEAVGVDHKTVATVRIALGNSPEQAGPRIGKDGRRLPPPRPMPPPTPAPVMAEPTDPTGRVIPEDRRDLWNRRADLRQIGAQVHAARRALEALIEARDPLVIHVSPQRALAHFKNAAGEIDAAVPAFLCPYCQGRGHDCRACKGQGFVSRFYWRTMVPAELKTANGGTEDGSEADNGTPEPEEVAS